MYVLTEQQPGVPEAAQLTTTIYPRRDLGVDFEEREGLAYLDSAFFVYASEQPDGMRYDVVSTHSPLQGQPLTELLDEVAPKSFYKRGARTPRGGIIDDWNILDSTTSGLDAEDSFNARLIHLHTKLGQPWLEFSLSQPAFITALREVDATGLFRNFDSPRGLIQNASKRHLLNEFIEGNNGSVERVIEALDKAGVKHADQFVLRAVANSPTLFRRKQRHKPVTPQTEAELFRRYSSAPSEKRIGVLQKLIFQNLPQHQRIALEGHLADANDHAVVEGEKWAIPKNELKEDVSLAELVKERRTVSQGAHDMDVIEIPLRNGETKTIALYDSKRRVRVGTTLVPHLSWLHNADGTRALIFERSSLTFPEGETRHIDGVLGALVLAYIQPEQRRTWPKTFHIDRKVQVMEAAQVPVLAIMKEKDLLGGEFVEMAEAA